VNTRLVAEAKDQNAPSVKTTRKTRKTTSNQFIIRTDGNLAQKTALNGTKDQKDTGCKMMRKPWWMTSYWNLLIAAFDIFMAVRNYLNKQYIWTAVFIALTAFSTGTFIYINKKERQRLEEEIIDAL
jgi:hypothetical protein